jgi:hypothetical protein
MNKRRSKAETMRLSEMQDLKYKLAEKTADHQRTQRVAQIAMRDALRYHALGVAVCEASAAAHRCLGAGLPGCAELLLSAVQSIEAAVLRREPSYAATLPIGEAHDSTEKI